MRVHTDLIYGALRYRVLGDVTPEAVRILALEFEATDGQLLSVPAAWLGTLKAEARAAVTDALRAALDAYHTRLTVLEGGRSST
jgi:hypothetical protein